jgi:hypothetical protein
MGLVGQYQRLQKKAACLNYGLGKYGTSLHRSGISGLPLICCSNAATIEMFKNNLVFK